MPYSKNATVGSGHGTAKSGTRISQASNHFKDKTNQSHIIDKVDDSMQFELKNLEDMMRASQKSNMFSINMAQDSGNDRSVNHVNKSVILNSSDRNYMKPLASTIQASRNDNTIDQGP